jgi:hypothetical protein
LAVAIVLVFAALTCILARPSPPVQRLIEPPSDVVAGSVQPVETYLLPATPHSARSLYDRAEQVAKEWQPDAALTSAVASWPFVTQDDLSGPVDWTFSFFSPGTQRIYVLNVYPERIVPLRETLSPYPLPVVALEGWRVDSHQALSAWLNGGGGDFLRSHPVVDVSVRLGLEDGRAAWGVAGVDRESGSTFAVRLDAALGKRVE